MGITKKKIDRKPTYFQWGHCITWNSLWRSGTRFAPKYSNAGPASDTSLVGVEKTMAGASAGTPGLSPCRSHGIQTAQGIHKACCCSRKANALITLQVNRNQYIYIFKNLLANLKAVILPMTFIILYSIANIKLFRHPRPRLLMHSIINQ